MTQNEKNLCQSIINKIDEWADSSFADEKDCHLFLGKILDDDITELRAFLKSII